MSWNVQGSAGHKLCLHLDGLPRFVLADEHRQARAHKQHDVQLCHAQWLQASLVPTWMACCASCWRSVSSRSSSSSSSSPPLSAGPSSSSESSPRISRLMAYDGMDRDLLRLAQGGGWCTALKVGPRKPWLHWLQGSCQTCNGAFTRAAHLRCFS